MSESGKTSIRLKLLVPLMFFIYLMSSLGCISSRYSYQEDLMFRKAVSQGDIQAIRAWKLGNRRDVFFWLSVGSIVASVPSWGGAAYQVSQGNDTEANLFATLGGVLDLIGVAFGLVCYHYHSNSEFYREEWMRSKKPHPVPSGSESVWRSS